ncbi:iron-siderophore ABC transporter substrate-binding protein [Cellulomonas denverensis]|uniref:Iron-siderophore ABC transporter substrate-binding protein n=2 Tax=Cellulomonas denverensis TaxID=264297 RepID=A0A7X6KX08_9CELL|nr:iron-siderophore ABC transporter substrate-binding protein [Cellulomonas denverensis]NKY23450.1 iron-siderophore ABC transporter substrate-binding protein [Cellulomonas denverensis]
MKSMRVAAGLAAVAVLALSACSSTDDSADSGESTAGTGASASAEGAFPATVDTKFGEVTIESRPERIVALGWGDAETALSLGYQPVGASDWLAFGGDGVGPWAEGLYDESPEIIDTLEPSYEAIAALEPDLILDVKSSGDQDRYDRLSEIATTVGVPEGGDSYLTTGQQQLELISAALGVPEKGEELQTQLEDAFTAARDEHPDWAGKTIAAATRTSEGWGAYIEGGDRVDFLENLGFVQSPTIADLPVSSSGFSVDISAEQLDLLDADLIVAFPIYIDTAEITDDPQWQAIPAVADGRAVVIDGDLSSAYSLGTIGAQTYALENLVPLIEDALGS